MKNSDAVSHEVFLKGYTEHKRRAAKYAIIVPLVLFAAQWAYSTTAHFQSIPLDFQIVIWVVPVLAFLITAFIMVASRKCPVCRDRMNKLDPADNDYDTTYKYYCEKCKVWVDRGTTNGTD